MGTISTLHSFLAQHQVGGFAPRMVLGPRTYIYAVATSVSPENRCGNSPKTCVLHVPHHYSKPVPRPLVLDSTLFLLQSFSFVTVIDRKAVCTNSISHRWNIAEKFSRIICIGKAASAVFLKTCRYSYQ